MQVCLYLCCSLQQCQSFSRPCPFTRDCESETHVSVCFLFLYILVGGDGREFSLYGSMLCQEGVGIDTGVLYIATVETHCLIQKFPSDVYTFSAFWVRICFSAIDMHLPAANPGRMHFIELSCAIEHRYTM